MLTGRESLCVQQVNCCVEGNLAGQQLRRHVKPGGRGKGHALALTLTDQFRRDRLHTTGRTGFIHGAPQYGRDLVAHEAVKKPTTLLGVH